MLKTTSKIEDGVDEKKHRTAQHETIKDIKSILKHAVKVDKDEIKIMVHEDEGHKDSTENHYVYVEDEEGVIDHLREEFAELDKKLEELKNSDKTIVIVSHNLDQIEKLCTRAIWINDGALAMDGKPHNVIEEYLKKCG